MENDHLNKTPLYNICHKYAARFTPFAGWLLPLQFSGILQEAKAVRYNAGLFDVSHMGEIEVTGVGACAFLNSMLTNNVDKARDGQVIYAILCFPDGGAIDDLLIYKYNDERFLLVVNAINTKTVLQYLKKHTAPEFMVEITDRSAEFALLALQGPNAVLIMRELFPPTLSALKPFRFLTLPWEEQNIMLSRTGYTGEDGFEIYLPPTKAEALWQELMRIGEGYGLLPAGLGARDLLRQEAGLPLYGQELSPQISPVQAGLERFIDWSKPKFSGLDSLQAERNNPATPRRIGLISARAAIPRPGVLVYWEDQPIGQVTSGTFSPVLQKGIGMALVNPIPPVGSKIALQLRGDYHQAERASLPFYQRKR